MENTWALITVGVLLLVAAVPYVRRIRHPDQRLLAAYLIFMTLTLTGSVVMYALLVPLFQSLSLLSYLKHPVGALVFTILIFLPGFLLGSWQARKPPVRRRP